MFFTAPPMFQMQLSKSLIFVTIAGKFELSSSPSELYLRVSSHLQSLIHPATIDNLRTDGHTGTNDREKNRSPGVKMPSQ